MNKMPVVFVGHGSPMNAIEDNQFTRNWVEISKQIPIPEAILAISGHWVTDGTRINDDPHPEIVHDMYGFPRELYEVDYRPKGAPELAHFTKDLILGNGLIDNSWGIDHGIWSILKIMYPEADIPVYHMSVSRNENPDYHFNLGNELKPLRDKGILIFASGNVVHNLAHIKWDMKGGYDWAVEFDDFIKGTIFEKKYRGVIDYRLAGVSAKLSVPTSEHLDPLFYILGAADEHDQLSIYNDSCTMGSLSMTSYLLKE
ncbi:LigB family dioxygenase [Desulfosporosinus acididurans]|uniref:LigB family dioxygenase n=1 Tax=Desulfosporosinus acididurans TaxID=476652 RepID=A0A0J1FS38_9FIRM|nr:4,5-DOPA dioxygenase extradiol [Desulfosporosinus acididurans]KLU65818.1 LigB family dioxygenase [Desulfosporosinus acididurans]